ncbi:hypothetical protein AAC387_Pa05g1125 [Persea americana]
MPLGPKSRKCYIAFKKEDLLLGETKHNRPLYFTGYIKEMSIHRVQINPGYALNLISTSALEELGIPPSKLSHTSVSIFGYDGSAQRPIGKIRFSLQIGDLISEVTVYAIKPLHATTSFLDALGYTRTVSFLRLYISASSLLATTA